MGPVVVVELVELAEPGEITGGSGLELEWTI